MSRDTFEARGFKKACHLTEQLKKETFNMRTGKCRRTRQLEDGGWQNDLAAVVETGSMISVATRTESFPFLAEGDEDELND